jgi:hypothetical protein
MAIIVILPKILPSNVNGMTIWPFIFVKDEKLLSDSIFLNHEMIHIKQQLEMLVIPFYIFYIFEWLVRLLMKGNAYSNISFENEAYSNENNINYLNERKLWSFIKYLKNPQRK